jgi:hypothetical protein
LGHNIEHKFRDVITNKYITTVGSSASGIDFPDEEIDTDIKTTFITQPQSSCPFRSARQKIFGLGYNLLLFVYKKDDKMEHNLEFLHADLLTEQEQQISKLQEG